MEVMFSVGRALSADLSCVCLGGLCNSFALMDCDDVLKVLGRGEAIKNARHLNGLVFYRDDPLLCFQLIMEGVHVLGTNATYPS